MKCWKAGSTTNWLFISIIQCYRNVQTTNIICTTNATSVTNTNSIDHNILGISKIQYRIHHTHITSHELLHHKYIFAEIIVILETLSIKLPLWQHIFQNLYFFLLPSFAGFLWPYCFRSYQFLVSSIPFAMINLMLKIKHLRRISENSKYLSTRRKSN